MVKILIDMNRYEFQKQLYKLDKDQRNALLNTLEKISKLSWEEAYKDKGVRWELIHSKKTREGFNVYSLRFSRKYRLTAYREGDWCVLIDIFPDHDGAYE